MRRNLFGGFPSLRLGLPVVLTVFASPMVAQTGGNTTLGLFAPDSAGFAVDGGVEYALPSDLKSPDGGDVGILRYPVRLSYHSPGSKEGFYVLNALYEYADCDWSDVDWFGATDRFQVSAIGLRRLGESDWGLFGFGQVSWTAEANGGSLGRGFSSTFALGPAYRFSPRLSVTIGALASTRQERDVRVVPVAALNWQISDRWHLRTLNGAVLSFVPDEAGAYRIDFLSEFRSRGIRLRQQILPDNSVDRPAVEEREIAVGLGLGRQFSGGYSVQLYAEYAFGREWEFRSDESRYREVEAKETAVIGLQVKRAF